MSSNNEYAAEHHRPRCGNCHHAIDSTTAGEDMVACSLLLEYRCADQLGGCEHHICRAQGAAGEALAG